MAGICDAPAATPGEDAPAKINLALAVTGKRGDGYHLLESLAVFTRYGDRVHAEAADSDLLVVGGACAGDLAGHTPEDNLVVRARDLLRSHLAERGIGAAPVTLRLEKNLPVAAGIGGGSADAAATLRLLLRHWGADRSSNELAGLALRLGADVPMCLERRALIARGIGEEIEPVEGLTPLPMVLANPRVAVSTPAVFRALASPDNAPLPPLPENRDIAAMAAWVKRARNDLLAPAVTISPKIGTCLETIEATGPLAASMSGSGATCFGIYASDDKARRAATRIAAARPDWFVTATVAG